MPEISQLDESPWLNASHLDGESFDAIIDHVTVEEFKKKDGGVEKKGVIHFRNWTKQWSLNKTNREQIAAVVGKTNTDDWGGYAITLFITTVSGPNGQVPGIRVMNKAPDASATADAPVPAACTPMN